MILPVVRPIAARHWLAGLAVVAAAAAILLAMGRSPICTCGTIKLWVGEANSADNSQQVADWYTLSHIIHGFLFYWLLTLAAPRVPPGGRLVAAIVVEAAWEILENSPIIIDRYREATFALGYAGDSVLNSVSDILFMAAGFLAARHLPVWLTVALALAFELLALYAIRDNLTLNVLMLFYPIDAIKTWQSGG